MGSRGLGSGDEVLGAVPFAGDHRLGWKLVDEIRSLFDIGDLPGREKHPQGIAQGIDRPMQFGG